MASSDSNRRILLSISICGAWASCSLAPIGKYLGYWRGVCIACIAIALIFLGLHLVGKSIRKNRLIPGSWFLLLYLSFVAAFAVLYPFMQKHTLNGGSDREDALRIELTAVAHHHYPYDARTFLGNPPTPLPGAMVLALPFYEIGHISWQNLFWLAPFLLCLLHLFRNWTAAMFFIVVFLALSPSNLSDFVTGGDYLANFFYFAVAVTFLVHTFDRPFAWSVLATVFMGLVLSSRSIYFVATVPLASLIWQRTDFRRAVILFATICVAASAITLPVFFPHPLPHLLAQLSQGSGKLRYIPSYFHAQWTLPLLALLIASVSIFIRMNLKRFFLIFALSACVVVLPPIVTLSFHVRMLPYECSYLAIFALPYGLWALSRYEDLAAPSAPEERGVSGLRQSRDNWLTTA
jgi:hypothetical protein